MPVKETLLTGWTMFAGDDARFQEPSFEDSKWKAVDLSKDLQQFPEFKKAGIIWVRLHLSIDSSIARTQLVAHIIQYSASEIYLNGQLLKKYGTIGDGKKKTVAWLPSGIPFDLDLVPGKDNVIAARLAYQPGIPYISYLNEALPALNIYVDNKESAVKNYEASEQQTKIYIIIFSVSSGTMLIIGFIYLVYFWFDRSKKVHLYYALAMLTQCLNALPVEVWGTNRFGPIGPLMWVFYFEAAVYTAGMAFILLTIYVIFNYPHRLFFKILAVISIMLVAGLRWNGTQLYFILTYIYPNTYLFGGIYACVLAIKAKKRDAGILLAGLLIFAISTLLSVIIPVNSISAQLLFYVSQMFFPVGMSFYLGIQNSLTNKKLRTSLKDVQELSEKNISQEQEKQELLSNQNIILEQQVAERTAALHRSLTDLKAAQSQLIQSEKMASLGELTAGIAHEIQNPLNFVNNFSEVNKEMVDEVNDELDNGNVAEAKDILRDIKDNSEKINHHGKRADAIVKGMLQHSQSNRGNREATDINSLADEYLRLAYHGLRAKDNSFNAILKTDFDESIGKINVVPQDIGRVILNLITNAFYAVQEKRKRTTYHRQPDSDDGPPTTKKPYEPAVFMSTRKVNNTVEISVADNGNGIPASIKNKIFQPFFTTKPTGQGTGLGLSLAYDIINAHGGSLTVKSKEGEGSEFLIQIPNTF